MIDVGDAEVPVVDDPPLENDGRRRLGGSIVQTRSALLRWKMPYGAERGTTSPSRTERWRYVETSPIPWCFTAIV